MKILSDVNKIRLDKFLSKKLDQYSRMDIKRAIEEDLILVNEISQKASYKLKKDDVVTIKQEFYEQFEILPENIKLEIVYENDDFAIIDKPENLIVHPAGSIVSGTLENALLYHFKNLSDLSGEDRKGIVHRLDKDTTGLIIIAKNNQIHQELKDKFKNHEIYKEYEAIVHGSFNDKTNGIIDLAISRSQKDRRKMQVSKDGRSAITKYEVISQTKSFSHLKLIIETGRTHQIRVHLSHINHPIIGDPLYNSFKENFKLDYQMLHCRKIGFTIGKKNYEFEAKAHKKFNHMLKILNL
ncbi:MAG: RluA family pseudouridine synthase [Tissierellia bacterium]|nr:RluA family pseudouridine synthase [Tissierellia bacterium]